MMKQIGLLLAACSLVTVISTVNASEEAPVVNLNSGQAPVVQASAGAVDYTATENAADTQGAPTANEANVQLAVPQNTTSIPNDKSGALKQLVEPATANMSIKQRVARLEQQMQNLTQMNLPQEIASLQQQMQALSGQVQVLQHDLKLLNNQQRSFYQDLNQRIKQLQNLKPSNSSGNPRDTTASHAQTAVTTDIKLKLKESAAYKKAFDLLISKKYDLAKQAFVEYLKDYPNGDFVANTHYWLGEIYLLQKNFIKAGEQFTIVISKFPESRKIADAELKLASVHISLGKKELAKRELLQIKKKYPGSTAAQLASIELQKLQLNAK